MTDLNKIVGTWPGETDDGFEKDIQEARHGYPPWQPMRTAPRDKNPVLLCYEWLGEHKISIAEYRSTKYRSTKNVWIAESGYYTVHEDKDIIYGWMPLPEPAKEVVK